MTEGKELLPVEGEKPLTAVAKRGKQIMGRYDFVKFKGRCMVLQYEPFPHYVALRKQYFDDIAYEIHDGLTRGQVSDAYAYVQARAACRDDYAHYISFGLDVPTAILHPELNDYDIEFSQKNKQMIWDTKALDWVYGGDPDMAIWRSPYPRSKEQMKENAEPIEFIMQLAGNDPGVYDDIMQSIAPIIMDQKPDGVIWWIGDGANGKSTLMDALYRIFPGQFTSLTVKALEDGRDAIALNGALANIVKESSEGRVDDTESYKALGTHESFRTHKFHSQETELVDANLHSIFSANSVPAFNDKGHSAKRRTFIIPFNQRFKSDPDFEKKTFTAEFFSRLVSEMAKYAQRVKKQNYRYKWSVVTTGVKDEYDREAGNAEQYAKEMINQGLVAFNSFNPLRMDYENWCADNGYPPLGINNLRKAMRAAGFQAINYRQGNSVGTIYRLSSIGPDAPLESLSLGRPGLFTTTGFKSPNEEPDPEPVVKNEQTSILNHKW